MDELKLPSRLRFEGGTRPDMTKALSQPGILPGYLYLLLSLDYILYSLLVVLLFRAQHSEQDNTSLTYSKHDFPRQVSRSPQLATQGTGG